MGNNIINNTEDKDINLGYIYNFVLKNKKIFFTFIILSLVIGVFNAYTAKKIWEGEFQIVLDKNEKNQFGDLGGFGLERFAGFNFNNENNVLKTEVRILESPLVLREVFNFVKEENFKKDKNESKNISFKDWKEASLRIDLEKGTSVLNLAYRDNSKEIIIPVLEKISKSYQEYSNRKRLRSIDLSKKFFEEQIALYKKKSLNSLKNIETFANEQNLLSIQVFSMGEKDKDFIENINIEAIKIFNFNEIKKREMQLKSIEGIKKNEDLIYFAKSYADFLNEGQDNSLIKKIEDLDGEILLKKLSYKESDPLIINLRKRKDAMYDLLRSNIVSYLKAKKEIALAELKASERPDGVLVKYKQLITEAVKDKQLLSKLETQYRAVLLEEARIEDPWELITSPTLLRYPVAPSKRRIVLLYLIFGISLSTIISYTAQKYNFKFTK